MKRSRPNPIEPSSTFLYPRNPNDARLIQIDLSDVGDDNKRYCLKIHGYTPSSCSGNFSLNRTGANDNCPRGEST